MSTTGDDSGDDLLTIEDVMRSLRCGRSKVYELISKGMLDTVKIIRSTRITKKSLRKLIEDSRR